MSDLRVLPDAFFRAFLSVLTCCKVPMSMWSYQRAISSYWNRRMYFCNWLISLEHMLLVSQVCWKNKSVHTKQLLAPIRHHSSIRWCQTGPVVETPNLPHHIGSSRCTYPPVVDVSLHEGPTAPSSSVLHHSRDANFARRGTWRLFNGGVKNPSHGNGMQMAGTSFQKGKKCSKKNSRGKNYLSFWIGIHFLDYRFCHLFSCSAQQSLAWASVEAGVASKLGTAIEPYHRCVWPLQLCES